MRKLSLLSHLSRYTSLFVITILVIGIGAAGTLLQQSQDNRERACNWITTACGSGCSDNKDLYSCPAYSGGGTSGSNSSTTGQVSVPEGCDNGVSVGGTACRNAGDRVQYRCLPGSRPGASQWQEEACSGSGTCQGTSCTTTAQTTGSAAAVTPSTCDNSAQTAYSCRGKTVGTDNGGCTCQITRDSICGCFGYALNLANGTSCVANENCTSGSCVDGRCAGPRPDNYVCASNADCLSNNCVSGVCGAIQTQSSETSTTTTQVAQTPALPACQSTVCNANTPPMGSTRCQAASGATACCPTGQIILSGNVCGLPPTLVPTPVTTPRPNGASCGVNSSCASGYCNTTTNKCAPVPAANGANCSSDAGCQSGYCDPALNRCANRPVLAQSTPNANPTPKPVGFACSRDSQCETGYCNQSTNKCAVRAATDSLSTASPTVMPTTQTSLRPLGASCAVDSSCASNWCNTATNQCAVRALTADQSTTCGGHNQIVCANSSCDSGCTLQQGSNPYCSCASSTEVRLKNPDASCSLYVLTPSSGCESGMSYADSTCSSGYRCGRNTPAVPALTESTISASSCSSAQQTACRAVGFQDCTKTGSNFWNFSCQNGVDRRVATRSCGAELTDYCSRENRGGCIYTEENGEGRERCIAASTYPRNGDEINVCGRDNQPLCNYSDSPCDSDCTFRDNACTCPVATPTPSAMVSCGGHNQIVCQSSSKCQSGCAVMGGQSTPEYCSCASTTQPLSKVADGECSLYVQNSNSGCTSGTGYTDLACASRTRCGEMQRYVPTPTPTATPKANNSYCSLDADCDSQYCNVALHLCQNRPASIQTCSAIQRGLCRLQQKSCLIDPDPTKNSLLGMRCYSQNEQAKCSDEMFAYCATGNRGSCVVTTVGTQTQESCSQSSVIPDSPDELTTCGGNNQLQCKTTFEVCDRGCTASAGRCNCSMETTLLGAQGGCLSSRDCAPGLECRNLACVEPVNSQRSSNEITGLPICSVSTSCGRVDINGLATGATPCQYPYTSSQGEQQYAYGQCCPAGKDLLGNKCLGPTELAQNKESIPACESDLHCYPSKVSNGLGACVRENEITFCCPRGTALQNGVCVADLMTCSAAQITACRNAGFQKCLKGASEAVWDYRCEYGQARATATPTPIPTPTPTPTPRQFSVEERTCTAYACDCLEYQADGSTVYRYQAAPYPGDICPQGSQAVAGITTCKAADQLTCIFRGGCQQGIEAAYCADIPLCSQMSDINHCESTPSEGLRECRDNRDRKKYCEYVPSCSSDDFGPSCARGEMEGTSKCIRNESLLIYCCRPGMEIIGDRCVAATGDTRLSCGGDNQSKCSGEFPCDAGCRLEEDETCACDNAVVEEFLVANDVIAARYHIEIGDASIASDQAVELLSALENYQQWYVRALEQQDNETIVGSFFSRVSTVLAEQEVRSITCGTTGAMIADCAIRDRLTQQAEVLARAQYLADDFQIAVNIMPTINAEYLSAQLDAINYMNNLFPPEFLQSNIDMMYFYEDNESNTGGYTYRQDDLYINVNPNWEGCGEECENYAANPQMVQIYTHELNHNVEEYLVPSITCNADTRIDDCVDTAAEVLLDTFEGIGLYFDENGRVDTSRTPIALYEGTLDRTSTTNGAYEFHTVGSPAVFHEFFSEALTNTMIRPEWMKENYPEVYSASVRILGAEYETVTDAQGVQRIERISP